MLTEFRSIQDVWEQLQTEADARRFLEAAIWGEVPICPHCEARGAWTIRGKSARAGLYQCRSCRRQFTITTKTPLHATKLDLRGLDRGAVSRHHIEQGHLLGRSRPAPRHQPEDQLEDGARHPRDDGRARGVEAGEADRHRGGR